MSRQMPEAKHHMHELCTYKKIDMKQSTTRNKLNLPMPHNANRAYKQNKKI